MPRKPINFALLKIYKICCLDLAVKDEYVGSSTEMSKRRCGHKSMCTNPKSNEYNFYVYQFIRAHGGWDNWQIVVIEEFACENKEQARTRERHWMETLGATLNSRSPIVTREERRECHAARYRANAEKITACYRANAEKISKRNSERITCTCGIEHSRGKTAQHKRSVKHIEALKKIKSLATL